MLSFAFIIVFVLYGNASILSNLANIKDSINDKSIGSTNAKTKSNVVYIVMSGKTMWLKLDKCLVFGDMYVKVEDIGNSLVKMSYYTDSGCTNLQTSSNLPYTSEAPSMKYFAEVYSDNKCSNSANYGALANSLDDDDKLNECVNDGSTYIKITCNE